MKLDQNQFLSTLQVQDQYLNRQKDSSHNRIGQGQSFQEILKKTAETVTEERSPELKFSKHATNRLAERNIELTQNQLERLSDGTRKADLKGIHDSLVIVDELAFIVNVPSSTVITAMEQTQTDENVFTNIDGAVII